jgi:hypothetical protein
LEFSPTLLSVDEYVIGISEFFFPRLPDFPESTPVV